MMIPSLRRLLPTRPAAPSRRGTPAMVAALLLCCSDGFDASANPAGRAPADSRTPEYNRDVRPILSDNCFLCHGPDQNTRKAKLRLDLREEALRNGAIVPGQPDKSSVIERVYSTDPEELMPPAEAHKTLTLAQKDTLRRWIAAGAEYQPHWAYVKPTRPEVPAVKGRKFVGNAIDAFIVAALEERGLKPAPEADRRTLLRRLSLDLTGLPPSPEELAAFLADRRPDAYERQVDRLLASSHYGERMAVPWLDLARFSDTVGYHGDQGQRVFPYRDYVIQSFHRNKRFDQFTIEQLAGDLLPNATEEQRIATGFNRLNMMTREGGAQPKEYLAKYAADRVRTVGTTWLGSTMGCSECHDHKFDPFTMRDFYSMAAFFGDVKQWGVYQDYKYTPNPDLKGWSNDHPFPPELEVESESLRARAARLRREIQALFLSTAHAGTNAAEPLARWEQSARESLSAAPDGWTVLDARIPEPPAPRITTTTNVTAGVTNLVRQTNAVAPAVVAEAGGAFRVSFADKKEEEKVAFDLAPGRLVSLRIERPVRARETSNLRISVVLRRDGKDRKIAFYRAEANVQEPRYFNGEEIPGILDGWRPGTVPKGVTPTGVWLADPPLETRKGDSLVVTFRSGGPVTARVSVSPFAGVDPLKPGPIAELQAALATAPTARTESDRALIAGQHLLATHLNPSAIARFKKLQAAWLQSRTGRAHTLVTVAASPIVTRVLPRGNWQNESGEIVQPSPPRFLAGPAAAAARDEARLSRLDLARWLVSRENPLTARVFMNRLWKQFFGTGLSSVVDDLGAQGEWPVNAPLLDWLAVDFVEGGWDVKRMVRQLVLSRTYRQSSDLRRDLLDVDPLNRWLTTQNPRRLEAEFVRDNALFVAGLLNTEIGGPSARPYQPSGYYANLQFPDRDYVADDDDRQHRRGLYTHWQRTFLHPMLANFDAPAREECTAARPQSNTPQQALTLLNDPTFVEAARVFGARLLRETPGAGSAVDRARIEAAFRLALGRAPQAAERSSLLRFLAAQRSHYAADRDEAGRLLKTGITPAPAGADLVELAAWAQVGRVILNLHESVTRY